MKNLASQMILFILYLESLQSIEQIFSLLEEGLTLISSLFLR